MNRARCQGYRVIFWVLLYRAVVQKTDSDKWIEYKVGNMRQGHTRSQKFSRVEAGKLLVAVDNKPIKEQRKWK